GISLKCAGVDYARDAVGGISRTNRVLRIDGGGDCDVAALRACFSANCGQVSRNGLRAIRCIERNRSALPGADSAGGQCAAYGYASRAGSAARKAQLGSLSIVTERTGDKCAGIEH